MIINVYGSKDEFSLKLNFPRINLDRRFNYKIGLSNIHYKIDTGAETIEDGELLSIVTNLIDLSGSNDKQTIAEFPFNSRKAIQNVKLPIVHFHPVQLYELENGSFELRRFFRNTSVDLKYIFLQFQIVRADAYGRL